MKSRVSSGSAELPSELICWLEETDITPSFSNKERVRERHPYIGTVLLKAQQCFFRFIDLLLILAIYAKRLKYWW